MNREAMITNLEDEISSARQSIELIQGGGFWPSETIDGLRGLIERWERSIGALRRPG